MTAPILPSVSITDMTTPSLGLFSKLRSVSPNFVSVGSVVATGDTDPDSWTCGGILYSGNSPSNLLDGTQNTIWWANSPYSLTIKFVNNFVYLTGYSLQSPGYDCPSGDKWNVTGTRDGVTWIPVDSQTNQKIDDYGKWKPYSVQNPGIYSSIKFQFTANYIYQNIDVFGSINSIPKSSVSCKQSQENKYFSTFTILNILFAVS